MKTISLAVSESDYGAFKEAAHQGQRSIAQLIREAMQVYRAEHLERRTPLRDLPVLVGHQLKGTLPTRAAIYDEVFSEDQEL